MNSLISKNQDKVIKILKNHKVASAYLFGSVLTEKFNKNSDVDFLITFEDGMDPIEYGDQYFNLIDQLELLLKRRVDLLTSKSIKNPYFIKELNKTKIAIYE